MYFCRIIKKQIPCDLVYEDDKVIGFKDISPQAPIHIIIIPKEHISDLNCLNVEQAEIIGHIFIVARKLRKPWGLQKVDTGLLLIAENKVVKPFNIYTFIYWGARMLQWPPG